MVWPNSKAPSRKARMAIQMLRVIPTAITARTAHDSTSPILPTVLRISATIGEVNGR